MISVAGVNHIDPSGVEALEKYVRGGGGVFFIASATTGADFVDRSLYRDGKGMFPVPLAGPAELTTDPLDNTPDVQSEDHAVFHNIGNRAGYISKIYVKKYFALAKDWNIKSDPAVRVIMRRRNGAPLLVEKNFGRGRVMVLLTSLSSDWNNWYDESLLYAVRKEPRAVSFPQGGRRCRAADWRPEDSCLPVGKVPADGPV